MFGILTCKGEKPCVFIFLLDPEDHCLFIAASRTRSFRLNTTKNSNPNVLEQLLLSKLEPQYPNNRMNMTNKWLVVIAETTLYIMSYKIYP